MTGNSRARWLLVLLVIVGLSAVAVAPAGAERHRRMGAQAASGTIRIAAEEEPTCADWIASCAGSSWGNWALGNLTLPQALNVSADGDYVPGPMLVDAPTLEPGPPMKVTYRIKPEAVWSDGEAITSADFEYTWKQIVNGTDIYDTTGYVDIASVDTTDPKTAVVTFKKPFAGWQDLFGGFYFVLPSHLLEGKSRSKAMKDGYAFSGGPWETRQGARPAGRRARPSRWCPTNRTGARSRRSPRRSSRSCPRRARPSSRR